MLLAPLPAPVAWGAEALTWQRLGPTSPDLPSVPPFFPPPCSCYDIDFVATADGALLAAHPADLQAAVGEKLGVPGGAASGTTMAEAVGRFTLTQVRQPAGCGRERPISPIPHSTPPPPPSLTVPPLPPPTHPTP